MNKVYLRKTFTWHDEIKGERLDITFTVWGKGSHHYEAPSSTCPGENWVEFGTFDEMEVELSLPNVPKVETFNCLFKDQETILAIGFLAELYLKFDMMDGWTPENIVEDS